MEARAEESVYVTGMGFWPFHPNGPVNDLGMKMTVEQAIELVTVISAVLVHEGHIVPV